MNHTENNHTNTHKSVISQFQEPQETKKIWQDPDKTKPDEEVQKPYANPDQKTEKDSNQESTGKVPTPQTKIGFKTPAEEKNQEQENQAEQNK